MQKSKKGRRKRSKIGVHPNSSTLDKIEFPVDFQQFVKTARAKLPKARIAFIAIKPSLSRWKLSGKMAMANSLVRSACSKNKRLDYIDIWQPMLDENGKPRPDLFLGDGLHLNAKGYALWTSIVKPHLVRRE